MIDVTKMNGLEFTINADLIEVIEEVPDTVKTTLIQGINENGR